MQHWPLLISGRVLLERDCVLKCGIDVESLVHSVRKVKVMLELSDYLILHIQNEL